MPLLSLLRCVGCRAGRLLDHGTMLECGECGRAYPVQAGVPVMVADAVADRGPLLDPAVAHAVMMRFGIPADPVSLLRVRRASGARVRFRGPAGGSRGLDGHVLAGLPGVVQPPAASLTVEGRPECAWLGDYVPRMMRPGEELLANVQFRNAGTGTMLAAGEGRVTIACQWTGAAGDVVDAPDVRTPLPADMSPGQVTTVPVRIGTPTRAGRYGLALSMVQEGVRWLAPAYGPLCIHVHESAGFTPPTHWVLDGPGPHDRDGDRSRATLLMRSWIGRHAPERPRVLELGSGVGPAVAQRGYDAMVVDSDLMALQLGMLVPGAVVPSLCADLADLPLVEAAFDAIVCFGTLHYQPDPAATLRNLRMHLRPGGFIGVFGLPVGQIWPGAPAPAVLGELRRGLNPQGFSLAEYAQIFRSARLHVAELVVDGASLKARLEPEGADA